MSCKGTKADGSPCQSPEGLILENGFCRAHDPVLGSERMAEVGRLGREAKRRKAAAKALTEEELGPLDSLSDAQRWYRIVNVAVAEGRLTDRAGNTIIRGVSEWVRAYESGSASEMYESIKAKLARLEDETATRGRKLKAVR